MKKLLLILLSLPMIGFGQLSTCGEEPNYTGNKFIIINQRLNINLIRKISLRKINKCNKFTIANIESKVKDYLNRKELKTIEGIYLIEEFGVNIGKVANEIILMMGNI